MDLITPLPPATITPTGPLRLSTHPGTGSLNEGVTVRRTKLITIFFQYVCKSDWFIECLPIDGRAIDIGNRSAYSLTNDSANLFE